MDFNEFNKALNEAVKAVREVRLDQKSDDDLRSMSRVLRQWQASQYAPEAPHAIEAIENEIARRQKDKHQEGIKTLHQLEMEQGKNLHKETMDELDEIKTSVNRLAHTRRIEWWILAAGWIAAVAGVAAVALELFLKR